MKCSNCNKGEMKKVVKDYVLLIPNGPSMTLKKIEQLECAKCGESYVTAITSSLIDKMALSKLVTEFMPFDKSMPASIAKWVRKIIGLSNNKLAEMTGMDPSAFTQAEKRNSDIDSMAKFFLLIKSIDYVCGSNLGSTALEALQKQLRESVVQAGKIEESEPLLESIA